MTEHERTSFTRAGDVLTHGVTFLGAVCGRLRELAEVEHPERVRMLLASFLIEERNLHGAIERYTEDAPAAQLETFVDFTIGLPEVVPPGAAQLTTLDLTRWLETRHQQLRSVFAELADTAPTGALREAFGGLAAQLEAHDRRLSKEYQRLEDL